MLMPKAIRVRETMKGTHHFVDPGWGPAEDRPFYFVITWQGEVTAALNPLSHQFLRFAAQGEIYVDGLTQRGEVPCSGELRVDYFRSHTISYRLEFDVEGEPFVYEGSKVEVDLRRPLMLVKTHTTCYGKVLHGDGTILSRSVTHFEPHTLVPFLLSFRLS